MPTSIKIKAAQQSYDAGLALFQENRYSQALAELKRAEDAFRKFDARGHPFSTPLPNGVSGLANTLALSGLCFQKLGDRRKAMSCYETSLINAKFEKRRPLKQFLKTLNANLIACYEQEWEASPPETITRILNSDPEIDTTFRFPYSLPEESITFARLYELAPERYEQIRNFYRRAKAKDAGIRRRDKRSDESRFRKMSFYIWGVLSVIWAVYGLVVARALLTKK